MTKLAIRSVVFRLAVLVSVASLGLAFITTGYGLWLDFRLEEKKIVEVIDDIQKTRVDSLASAIWFLDEEQMKTQVESILSLHAVEYVKITHSGKVTEFGKVFSEKSIEREIPLKIRVQDTDKEFGSLAVRAGLDSVYDHIFRKVTDIAAAQILEKIAMCIFVFYIFHRVIIKHIVTASKFVSTIEITNDKELKLDRKAGQSDELEQLVCAINEMKIDLKRSHRELLAHSANLEALVVSRTGELAAALATATAEKRKMQEILDHIRQGILTFDETLKIEPQFSRFLVDFYQNPVGGIAGQDVLGLVLSGASISGDQLDCLRNSLHAIVGEDLLVWEMNCEHLMAECSVRIAERDHMIAMDWAPVTNPQGMTERVMLAIRDLTEQRKLQLKVAEESAKHSQLMERVAQILRNRRTIVLRFLDDCRTTSQVLLAPQQTDPHQIFKDLHTIKGTARTFGLTALAAAAHEAEDVAQRWRSSGSGNTHELKQLLQQVCAEIEEYYRIATDVLPGSGISTNEADSLFSIAQQHQNTMRQSLAAAGCDLTGVVCADQVIQWRPESFSTVASMVMHCLNNSVDHGYVLPKSRGLSGLDKATIEMRAFVRDRWVDLEITDSGAGLDMEAIRALAAKKNFKPGPDESVLEVLFMDGVSTADKVTLSSGRGVGLAAIRQMARDLGGKVWLEPNTPKGTKTCIRLPAEQILQSPRFLAAAA